MYAFIRHLKLKHEQEINILRPAPNCLEKELLPNDDNDSDVLLDNDEASVQSHHVEQNLSDSFRNTLQQNTLCFKIT